MNITGNSGRARRWRALFAALVVVVLPAAGWPATGAHARPLDSSASSYPALISHIAVSPPSVQRDALRQQVALNPVAVLDPVPAPPAVSEGQSRYFTQTAHFLRGVFLQYWESHGATPILGLPITEPLQEGDLVVQYLERARLEWHPDISSDLGRQVLLTRLGAILAGYRGLSFSAGAPAPSTPTSAYFPETGHTLSNAFLAYWLRNGGLAVFGYPISEEVVEVSPTDGQPYTVQYFERNRFEWHPENPPAYNVQIGLLGVEYARAAGLNPLARVLLPGPVRGADRDLTDSPRLADLVEAELLPVVQALGRTSQFRWVPAVIVQYNIPVEFAQFDEEGIAGAFVSTRSRTRPFVIVVPESERGESLDALASVLAHEATHAFDVTSGVAAGRARCSIEEELRAYMNGLAAWVLLEGNAALASRYDDRTLADAVNSSVRGFNQDKNQLDFDFSPQEGRQYLRTLYGSQCGP